MEGTLTADGADGAGDGMELNLLAVSLWIDGLYATKACESHLFFVPGIY